MLELRVLSGTHAGARVLLPATPQQLGSGPDCDLVLTDAGILERHAEVTAQEDGTVLIRLMGADASAITLAQGEAVELGPVRIAIESADSAWRDDVPVRLLHAPGPQAHAEESMVATPPAAAPATDARPSARRIALPGLVLAALVVALGLLTWTEAAQRLWTQARAAIGSVASEPEAHAPAGSAETAAPPTPVARVSAVVAPLGLGSRVRVEADPRHGVRIKAAFLSDAEAATLRAALSTLPWSPRLDLISPVQMQAILEDHLITLAPPGSGQGVVASALPGGRFRIEGRVASAAERELLQQQLARAMPLIQGFEFQLGTDEEVAAALLQALREIGVGPVQGNWTGARLEGQVTLPQNLVPRWERGLAAALAQHPVQVNIALALTAPVAPPPPTLPFVVRSVIGTSGGFVVLDDGQRLAVEGQARGWRLAAIRSDAIVFEGPAGARITLER